MRDLREKSPTAEAEVERLCSALHLDPRVVGRFIADYLHLLDVRIHKVETDLDAGRREPAAIGLLSLASSSQMLGAVGIADAAEQLRTSIRTADRPATTHARTKLRYQAVRDGHRLRALQSVAE